ncbi:hypothetical protein HNQ08_004462 [Deinococcus humi]|uniref:Uncharacterized protein n=1 Tax=Deinococcus humi TaxID=662880 RepID=A0A7W8NGC2_9DEIO|nr:hypothetical protein [Deinococcus humi]
MTTGTSPLPQQTVEKRPGGLGIPVRLEEDVQHDAVFIDRSPQPVGDASDIRVP